MIQKDNQEEYTYVTQITHSVRLVGKVKGTQKQGRYYYVVECEKIIFAGVYENNIKIGFWMEVLNDIEIKNQDYVFSFGQYVNGLKNDKWIISQGLEVLGGGQYIDGQKTGPWIDVEEGKNFSRITLSQGLYENGIRKGAWRQYTIFAKLCRDVGGCYNENGQKDGLWIEFQYEDKIFGKYKNGVPIGYWRSVHGEIKGLYDDNGKKQGYWKDGDEEEGHYLDDKRVGYWKKGKYENGNYQDGLKTGEWIEYENHIQSKGKYEKGRRIGEWSFDLGINTLQKGSYDRNGLKQGKWTEILPKIRFFEGYYKNDKRVGRWQLYRNKKSSGLICIPCTEKLIYSEGYYEDGLKEGEWIEDGHINIYKNGFKNLEWVLENYDKNQIFLETYKNGKRTGKWIYFESYKRSNYGYQQIKGRWIQECGDEINELERKLKQGAYIFKGDTTYYLTDYFTEECEIAQKINLTDYLYQFGNETQNNLKEGMLNDKHEFILEYLNDDFLLLLNCEKMQNDEVEYYYNHGKSLIMSGRLQQGFQIGKWILKLKDENTSFIFGGGFYQNGFKNGYWIEPADCHYKVGYEVTYRGEYKDERRIGLWKIFYQNIEIGGGLYDEYGFKQGEWIETICYFNLAKQFTEQGIYKDGIRIGEWKLLFKRKKVGGGFYNDNGKRHGNWTIIRDYRFLQFHFNYQNLPIENCHYKDGECQNQ